MAFLVPDKIYDAYGVTVKEFLLTKHNPNNIALPQTNMKGNRIGVTIHNTPSINVASGTTQSEQHTRATYNGNMGDVRVHFYVDHVEAWQNLPLELAGWHAADGDGDGNTRTIAIECIMSGDNSATDKKAEENAARLAAYLLDMFSFDTDHLYTHQHWYSKKYCPAYILPHWDDFVIRTKSYQNYGDSISSQTTEHDKLLYRVRKEWGDYKSQIGAFSILDNAIKACTEEYKAYAEAYKVYDENGNVIYPIDNETANILPTLKRGDKGKAVESMQAVLIVKGYSCGRSMSDGDFGVATLKAVNDFKADHNLPINGVCDDDMWKVLINE